MISSFPISANAIESCRWAAKTPFDILCFNLVDRFLKNHPSCKVLVKLSTVDKRPGDRRAGLYISRPGIMAMWPIYVMAVDSDVTIRRVSRDDKIHENDWVFDLTDPSSIDDIHNKFEEVVIGWYNE